LREPLPQCPRCLQVIACDDAVRVRGGRVVHLDCQRPRHLSREERLLLFRYCRGHAVAKCPSCAQSFIQRHELASGLLDNRTYVCRRCSTDLTESIRHHLYGCAMLPAELRERAQQVRDAARRLVKESHQLSDRAEVLMRETEAAVAALRETMQLTAQRDSGGSSRESAKSSRPPAALS
jgi:hypothetical protein